MVDYFYSNSDFSNSATLWSDSWGLDVSGTGLIAYVILKMNSVFHEFVWIFHHCNFPSNLYFV